MAELPPQPTHTPHGRRGPSSAPGLPNTYLIGAPKCGTTSIAQWLGGHPDVYVSVPKEPFHWASDYPGLRRHHGFESRAAYEALFTHDVAAAAAHRVDASTVYLYSEAAISAILDNVPDARFIVAVRNPVDLVISYHRTQLVALNETEPDFATAWSRSLSGGLPDGVPLDPKLVDYPRVARLGAAIDQVLAAVSRERLHVVVFDDLRTTPLQVWSALTEFLDVAAAPTPDLNVHNVSAKAARYPWARRVTHRPPALLAGPVRRLRQWSRTTQTPLVRSLKSRMWESADRPEVAPEVYRHVLDVLRPDIEHLGRVIDIDVSGWLNDPDVP
jgi:hypothetical protein